MRNLTDQKTFNIWKLYNGQNFGSMGPWKYMSPCLALDEFEALQTAQTRYGRDGRYDVREGL